MERSAWAAEAAVEAMARQTIAARGGGGGEGLQGWWARRRRAVVAMGGEVGDWPCNPEAIS
jgi:hypothetical protein